MKVKKSSWHYKLNENMQSTYIEHSGHNLCRYFWMTVGSMCKVCIGCSLIALLFVLIGAISKGIWLGIASYCLNDVVLQIISWLFLTSVIITPSAAIYYLRRRDISTEIPTPNILVEFIKAKKNKYCPMIDFE